MLFNATFKAPPAPTVMTMRSAEKSASKREPRNCATFSLAARSPWFCMYPWLPFSASSINALLKASGGSTIGLPSEKSNTWSSPNSFFSLAPSSNSLRIHDPLFKFSSTSRITQPISSVPSAYKNLKILSSYVTSIR